MISENHDGKTEPASQATVWDFALGKWQGRQFEISNLKFEIKV